MYEHVYIYICTWPICIYIYASTYIYIYIYTCTYIYIHVRIHTHTHIYIYIHMYIYIYTYTFIKYVWLKMDVDNKQMGIRGKPSCFSCLLVGAVTTPQALQFWKPPRHTNGWCSMSILVGGFSMASLNIVLPSHSLLLASLNMSLTKRLLQKSWRAGLCRKTHQMCIDNH